MSGDAELIRLMRAIARRDHVRVGALPASHPQLALPALAEGATRQHPTEFFLGEIGHHIYCGDTAVHVAAPAHDHRVVRDLVDIGAPTTVAHRRGRQQLHYVADGLPDDEQAATIACLVGFGADPNARDDNGSSAMQLEHWTTGKRGSGAPEVRAEQRETIRLLEDAGAG